MNDYAWEITLTPKGQYAVSSNGILSAVFNTKSEATDFMRRLMARDQVERLAME
jgi:hypothetical protein